MASIAENADGSIAGISRPTRPESRWRFVLFDPTLLFRTLAELFAPLRWAALMLWPLTAFAGFTVIENWYALLAHTREIYGTLNVLQHVLLSMVTANLLSKLVQGTVISHLGGRVDRFGVRLLFGVYPRFFIPLEPVRQLSFRSQRTCYAAGLKTRLALFTLGALGWAMSRRSGTGIADAMLVLGQIGFGAFLFSLNPLWRADGYRWISAYFEQARLREDGLQIISLVFSGRRPPSALSRRRMWALFAYALLSVAYMTAFILLLAIGVAASLEAEFGGTGVFMSSVLMALMVVYLVSSYRRRASRKAARGRGGARAEAPAADRQSPQRIAALDAAAAERIGGTMGKIDGQPSTDDPAIATGTARSRRQARRDTEAAPTQLRSSPNLEALLDPNRGRRSWKSRWKALLLWAAVFVSALYVAFLPYPFEVGGEFVLQPFDRAEVRARTDGEIVEVLVQEGDWVSVDQVLARQSTWDEERDIRVREAEIAKSEAELATLVAGPRQEEISVAEKRIETAVVQVTAAKRELERQQDLLGRGAGADKMVAVEENKYLLALAELEEARAELDLLKAPVHESEVQAAEAAIARDTSDLEYKRLQLEHALIKATADGRVVTPLEQLAVGSFLPVGGLFAEIENSRTVLAEIEVPETDVPEVSLGASAELRLWSSPWESVAGIVRRISPKAEERDFGRIVRVLVEVPNPDERLTPNMTGYAKIVAEERPVWEAFTRSFVRFFEIEVWSWLP